MLIKSILNYLVRIADTHFQVPHMWNGVYIPSEAVADWPNRPGTYKSIYAETSSQASGCD
jgi:hypothetical protein